MECLTRSISGVKIVAKMEEDSIKEMFAGSKCGGNNGNCMKTVFMQVMSVIMRNDKGFFFLNKGSFLCQ